MHCAATRHSSELSYYVVAYRVAVRWYKHTYQMVSKDASPLLHPLRRRSCHLPTSETSLQLSLRPLTLCWPLKASNTQAHLKFVGAQDRRRTRRSCACPYQNAGCQRPPAPLKCTTPQCASFSSMSLHPLMRCVYLSVPAEIFSKACPIVHILWLRQWLDCAAAV